MDYLKHYNKLIERAKTRITEEYTESHHIIPRCMGGTDNKHNLVNLYPEEHYLAHQLLVKIYPNNKNLIFAASMMCVNRPSNKLYGWLRRRMSNNMKQNNPNAGGKSNRNRKGKYKMSEQARLNMSIAFKGLNAGEKNGMFSIKPWNHPRATNDSKLMWKNADKYYTWWVNSGLEHGQNPMARHFNEKFTMTHTNLVKYFRSGWVPIQDQEWVEFVKSCKI